MAWRAAPSVEGSPPGQLTPHRPIRRSLQQDGAALLIVRAFGHPWATGLTIAASLAQIGEFSFILAALGVALGLLPEEGRDLILAGAILSILLNPLIFAAVERPRARAVRPPTAVTPVAAETAMPMAALTGHDVLVGYGRVGSRVGARLRVLGRPLVVFAEHAEDIEAARHDGAKVVVGNAADPEVLRVANLSAARRLFVAIPEAFEAGQVVEQARAANPKLEIVARAHSDAEVEHLTALGANLTVMGEREIADRMLEYALERGDAPSGEARGLGEGEAAA
jgi:CPA2 family monovalent cation:H+ antiporter-2